MEKSVDLRRSDDNRIGQWQHRARPASLLEKLDLTMRLFCLEASQDFKAGHDRELETLVDREIRDGPCGHSRVMPLDDLRERYRIEEPPARLHYRAGPKNWLRSRAIASTSATSSEERPEKTSCHAASSEAPTPCPAGSRISSTTR